MKKILYTFTLCFIMIFGSHNLFAEKVNVRIESYNETLLTATIDVEPTDISDIVGGDSTTWTNTTDNKPLALQALVKALQEKGYNPKDNNILNANSGIYISKLLNVASGDTGAMDGWLFALNNTIPSLGINQQTLSDNDTVVFYFTTDFMEVNYSFFDKDNLEVFDTDLIKLTNYFSTWDDTTPRAIVNANLVLEKKNVDGTFTSNKLNNVKSDNNGLFNFTIDEVGTYNVTSWLGTDQYSKITRASATVVVKSKELYDLILEMEKVDLSKYTTDSKNKFTKSLEKAKLVYANNLAGQAEINKIIDELKENYDNLKVINNSKDIVDTTNSTDNNENIKNDLPATGNINLYLAFVMIIISGSIIVIRNKNI